MTFSIGEKIGVGKKVSTIAMLGPLLAMPSGQGLNMTLLAILKVNGANWLLVLEKNWSCGKMFLLLTRYHYWLDNIRWVMMIYLLKMVIYLLKNGDVWWLTYWGCVWTWAVPPNVISFMGDTLEKYMINHQTLGYLICRELQVGYIMLAISITSNVYSSPTWQKHIWRFVLASLG